MSEPRRADLLAARPSDPGVGVHALSEQLYCSRAALLTLEDDDEPDDRPLTTVRRGDYWPLFYTEHQLLRQLAIHRREALVVLALTALTTGVTPLWFYRDGAIGPLLTGLLALTLAWIGAKAFLDYLRICRDWVTLHGRMPLFPSTDLAAPLPVHWWDLRQAGFEVLRYEQLLTDPDWKVAGQPWRVLRHGSLRIPVIRMGSDDRQLSPKHWARIAAYCHLLETCEGAESPYGLVLFRHSYDGLLVPNNAEGQRWFYQGLRACRQLLTSPTAPPPPHPGACAHCPHGAPQPLAVVPANSEPGRAPAPPYPLQDSKGRVYHNACGDRFRWTPPHERALRWQLQEMRGSATPKPPLDARDE